MSNGYLFKSWNQWRSFLDKRKNTYKCVLNCLTRRRYEMLTWAATKWFRNTAKMGFIQAIQNNTLKHGAVISKSRNKRIKYTHFQEWHELTLRLKRVKAFMKVLQSSKNSMELETRQKITLGIFTLSNLYDEELESKGWNRKEVALAAKDVVDICLLKHINDDDDDDDDDDNNNISNPIQEKGLEEEEETEGIEDEEKVEETEDIEDEEVEEEVLVVEVDSAKTNQETVLLESVVKVESEEISEEDSRIEFEIKTLKKMVDNNVKRVHDRIENSSTTSSNNDNNKNDETTTDREEEYFLAMKKKKDEEELAAKEDREKKLASMNEEDRLAFLLTEADQLEHRKKQDRMLKTQSSSFFVGKKKKVGGGRGKKKKKGKSKKSNKNNKNKK